MLAGADVQEIAARLEGVGARLGAETKLVLIGGYAMVAQGTKPATKDIDIVLRQVADPHALLEAFAAEGFETVDGYYLPGAPLDPHTMLENDAGVWFDLLLPDDLFGGLSYSEAMAERELGWLHVGLTEVRLADLSTIFLLKLVTGRWRRDIQRDIPDLRAILATGHLDWAFLQAEWDRQMADHRDPERLRALAREALDLVGIRRGRFVP